MNKKMCVFSAVFLLVCSTIYAQPAEEFYRFSSDIAHSIDSDTTSLKDQMGATYYSMSGYYKKALVAWDHFIRGSSRVSKEDSLYFRSFSPVRARDYILERSKKEQIVMINEAHHNPRHRTFTRSLLQGLYDNGYRYLGLEALFDTVINERKFPVAGSGFYTKEPEFGNLISEAIRIGFVLFGYEGSFYKSSKQREIEQAENIVRFWTGHRDGKMLIHCGYDHLNEGEPGIKSWEKAMGRRVKESLEIDPFTIDQTRYLERGDEGLNHPYIQMINVDYPAVLINEDGAVFKEVRNRDKADCIVIHPPTGYVNRRPNWLFLNGERKAYRIPSSKITQYPVLVLAYRKGEFDRAGVPADLLEVTDSEQNPELVLKNGEYEIVVKDKEYKVIEKYSLEMK